MLEKITEIIVEQLNITGVEITEDTFIVGKTRRKCHHCI